MTLAVSNDNPVLVAPRPVRLAAPFPFRTQRLVTDAMERLDELRISPATSEKDVASPRSSPRAALATEALEEFLSILRPSMFPPRSPVLRARQSAMAHERSYSSIGRLLAVEDADTSRAAKTPDIGKEDAYELLDRVDELRWLTSSVISSPVSRTNTRNPFQRHASYQLSLTPSPARSTPLSPAAVPLPLPTPDENADASS
ncbi:hypothetical protein CYLTODRAFT_439293 [Cylindrobasidium torrendii FP15055 ss-10]|uniref:Uncharacterized protein n=1 Tax=Cylindrobasidium torrendii FP15055 ss-10 TaxID=1314674 RepID=A0A0D7BVF1_9AGAR|nr:hypothetical protein CYLTODRAFT_439293 [Cylindrobasidium torrendii FP15055 ss-10]